MRPPPDHLHSVHGRALDLSATGAARCRGPVPTAAVKRSAGPDQQHRRARARSSRRSPCVTRSRDASCARSHRVAKNFRTCRPAGRRPRPHTVYVCTRPRQADRQELRPSQPPGSAQQKAIFRQVKSCGPAGPRGTKPQMNRVGVARHSVDKHRADLGSRIVYGRGCGAERPDYARMARRPGSRPTPPQPRGPRCSGRSAVGATASLVALQRTRARAGRVRLRPGRGRAGRGATPRCSPDPRQLRHSQTPHHHLVARRTYASTCTTHPLLLLARPGRAAVPSPPTCSSAATTLSKPASATGK